MSDKHGKIKTSYRLFLEAYFLHSIFIIPILIKKSIF